MESPHFYGTERIGRILLKIAPPVMLSQLIQALYNIVDSLFVGRAVDYVLKDRKDVVRVFIYAPEAYRIHRVMEVYGDTREEAERNVRRSDEARAAYYRSVSGHEWGSRKQYDLLVDSSVGLEETAEVIVEYLSARGLAEE